MRYLAILGLIFAFVVAVFAGDYYEQRKNADGGLPPAEYFAGLSDRAGSLIDGSVFLAASAMDTKTALPEPPQGWVRREWEASDENLLTGEDRTSDAYFMETTMGDKQLAGMAKSSAQKYDQKLRTTSYVYTRGDEMVVLSAKKVKKHGKTNRSNAVAAAAVARVNMFSEDQGFAVVQGVTWKQNLGVLGLAQGKKPGEGREFSANMGPYVLSLRSRMDDAAVRAFMDMFDYDGLNAALEEPLVGVGSDAPVLSVGQQIKAAEFVVSSEKDAKRAKSAQADANMNKALTQTEVERLLVNTLGGTGKGQVKNVGAPVKSVANETAGQMEMQVDVHAVRSEIKINRLVKTGKGSGSGCGAGKSCKVGGE